MDLLDGIVEQGEGDKALPSMPLLSLPSSPIRSKVEAEEELDSEFHQDSELSSLQYFSDDAKHELAPGDCEDLIFRGSISPPSDKRKLGSLQSHPPSKKKRKLEISDAVDGMDEEPGNHYAEAFFFKVKATLDETTFQNFITILSETQDEPGSAVVLYDKIKVLLADHPELVQDFIGTLKPHQALEIGKLIDLKFITRSLAFLRKLEGYQLTKLINALELMAANPNLTEETVKSTVSSLLKGHAHLAESFFHLLPNEKPPPPNSLDDYEDITDAMVDEGDDGGWENVRIPEHAERGCVIDCPCRCHTTPSQPFCLACNIRFIKGQAYVQYGKVIRYCKVHFGDISHDEVLQRFNPALYSKRKRKSRTNKVPPILNDTTKELFFQDENAIISKEDVQMVMSPKIEDKVDEDDDYWEEDDVSSGDKSSGGDMFEEVDRHSEDTEDNSNFLRQLNAPVSPLCPTVQEPYPQHGASEGEFVAGVVIDVSDIRPNGVNAHVIKFEKRPSDDPCVHPEAVQDCTVLFEDTKVSPEKKIDRQDGAVLIDVSTKLPETRAFSEVSSVSIKEEEYSETADPLQPNTDEISVKKDDFSEGYESSGDNEGKEWTRQEDKMILEAFQREIGTEETFGRIRNLMPARSVDQIQGRFQVLMNLLEKVASGSHDAHPP